LTAQKRNAIGKRKPLKKGEAPMGKSLQPVNRKIAYLVPERKINYVINLAG